MDYSSNNLTPNQKLQSIYHQINSGSDHYFIRHGLRAVVWLKNNNYERLKNLKIFLTLTTNLIDFAPLFRRGG